MTRVDSSILASSELETVSGGLSLASALGVGAAALGAAPLGVVSNPIVGSAAYTTPIVDAYGSYPYGYGYGYDVDPYYGSSVLNGGVYNPGVLNGGLYNVSANSLYDYDLPYGSYYL